MNENEWTLTCWCCQTKTENHHQCHWDSSSGNNEYLYRTSGRVIRSCCDILAWNKRPTLTFLEWCSWHRRLSRLRLMYPCWSKVICSSPSLVVVVFTYVKVSLGSPAGSEKLFQHNKTLTLSSFFFPFTFHSHNTNANEFSRWRKARNQPKEPNVCWVTGETTMQC